MTTLTKEELRGRVAELLGWKDVTMRKWIETEMYDPELLGIPPDGPRRKDWPYDRVPDYPVDLNAMHSTEQTLSDAEWNRYAYLLEWILEGEVPESERTSRERHLIHATAEQRARAFVAVKEGK